MPTLLIVSGASASGKTTLSGRLSRGIGLLLLSKDGIKKHLYDTLGQRDRVWSTIEGLMAVRTVMQGRRPYLPQDTM